MIADLRPYPAYKDSGVESLGKVPAHWRPSIDVDARFLGYAADCAPAAYQKACMGRGITVMHLYGSELKDLTVALPPLSEQAAIVRFLDHADRRIRRYIRAMQKLIADVVTGKLDVREAALPEVDPLAAEGDLDHSVDQAAGSNPAR